MLWLNTLIMMKKMSTKNIIILIINMKIKMDTLMKMMDLIHIFG